ncbi:hypothetical protein IPJ91_00355 [bacterium]|nr:MAG: hypothetical protein IPJ91_00355 [bacterium]
MRNIIHQKTQTDSFLSKDSISEHELVNMQVRSWNDISFRIENLENYSSKEMQESTSTPANKKFSIHALKIPIGFRFSMMALCVVILFSGIIFYNNYQKQDSFSRTSKIFADSLQKQTGLTKEDIEFLEANNIVSRTNSLSEVSNQISDNSTGNSSNLTKIANGSGNAQSYANTSVIDSLNEAERNKLDEILKKVPNKSDLIVREYSTSYFWAGEPWDYLLISKDKYNEMMQDPEIASYMKQYHNYTYTMNWKEYKQGNNSKSIMSMGDLRNIINIYMSTDKGHESIQYMGGKYAIQELWKENGLLENTCPEGYSKDECEKLDMISQLWSDPDLAFMIQVLNPANAGMYKSYMEKVDGVEYLVYETEVGNYTLYKEADSYSSKYYINPSTFRKTIERNYKNGQLESEVRLISYERIENGTIDMKELAGIELKTVQREPISIDSGTIDNPKSQKISDVSGKFLVFSLPELGDMNYFGYYLQDSVVQEDYIYDDLYSNQDFNPMYGIEQKISKYLENPTEDYLEAKYSFNLSNYSLSSSLLSGIEVSIFDGVNLDESKIFPSMQSIDMTSSKSIDDVNIDNVTKLAGETSSVDMQVIENLRIMLDDKVLSTNGVWKVYTYSYEGENTYRSDFVLFEYENMTYFVKIDLSDSRLDNKDNLKFTNEFMSKLLKDNSIKFKTISDDQIKIVITESKDYTNPNEMTEVKLLVPNVAFEGKKTFSGYKSETKVGGDSISTYSYNLSYVESHNGSVEDMLWQSDYRNIFGFNVQILTQDVDLNYQTMMNSNLKNGPQLEDVVIKFGNKTINAKLLTENSSEANSTLCSLAFIFDQKFYTMYFDGEEVSLFKDTLKKGEAEFKILTDKDLQ